MPGLLSYNKRGWPSKKVTLTKLQLHIRFTAIYYICQYSSRGEIWFVLEHVIQCHEN